MLLISGIAFGLVVGYLVWYAIRPNEKEFTLTTVSAFISIVVGAGITLAFPIGTDTFAGYSIGLASGFFATPIQKGLSKAFENRRERLRKERIKKQKIEMEKLNDLESNWSSDEKIIETVVNRKVLSVHLSDVNNLPYDKATKMLLMKKYAYLHHDKVELHDYGNHVTLWKLTKFEKGEE